MFIGVQVVLCCRWGCANGDVYKILEINSNDQAYNCLIHFYKRFQIKLALPGPIVGLFKGNPGAASPERRIYTPARRMSRPPDPGGAPLGISPLARPDNCSANTATLSGMSGSEGSRDHLNR